MTLTQVAVPTEPSPGEGAVRPRPRRRARSADVVMALAVSIGAIAAVVGLVRDGYWPVALLVVVVAGIIGAALLSPRRPHLRWLAPALVLLAGLVAYPALYVGYLSFTNYSSQHPVPLERAVELISTAPAYQIQVPGSSQFRYTVYRDGSGELLLWLSGAGEAYLARDGEPLVPVLAAAADGLVPVPTGLDGPVLVGTQAADLIAPGGAGELSGIPLTVRSFDPADLGEADVAGDGLVLDPDRGQLLDLRGERFDGWVPPRYAWAVVDDPGGPALWAVGGNESRVLDAARAFETVDLPPAIDGYSRLGLAEAVSGPVVSALAAATFGEEPDVVRLNPSDPTVVSRYEYRFAYDDAEGVFRDVSTGAVYRPVDGNFRLDASTVTDGEADQPAVLTPGFVSLIGLGHYADLFGPTQRLVLVDLFVWSVMFAGVGVVLAFLLGLGAAILVNDRRTPLRGLARSLLVLPYAMPVFLTVTLWRFFLDPTLGPVNNLLSDVGVPFLPNWTGDPVAARAAMILIMTWIFFPYFMLVGGGALQSINPELYGAAAVDGADGWKGFRYITLPLVFAACGPILVATFAFFFTNVTIVELFLRGGPPAEAVGTTYGYTDIVASYAYHQAFPPNGNADFGYASAVAVVVFVLLGALSTLQVKLSRLQEAWHEGS